MAIWVNLGDTYFGITQGTGIMLSRGSEWRRWEPHIHAPGTVMNNQFSGPSAWDDYLAALEHATPAIEALAVTDYYTTETYEEMLRHKATGRLPSVRLIFPNVELRLDVATARGGFVNLHLFVSPDDPQHLAELQRLLSRLQFNVMQDRFDCTRADLMRLGKKADLTITDDRAALAYGASQFKVNFQQLREVLSESGWAKKNILIAVAGGATDGTSGVREAADQTIRREIEGFAHVIFAGSPMQREFWLGQRDLSADEVRARYGGLKPCLHGSDAHKLDDVASPFGDRFSWIKGGLEFDALRQACIDPEGRAYVGGQARHAGSGMDGKQWDDFLLIYKGDVDKSLTGYIAWSDGEVRKLNGVPPPPSDPNVVLIADDADLSTFSLAPIAAEMTRLGALFSADKLVRDQYAALTGRIAQENLALQTLEARLTDAQGAAARRKELQAERDGTYGRVFEAILSEQNALSGLYAPLMARLAASSGTLNKLSFSVCRVADVNAWGTFAEEKLLDRRKAGPFYGRGSLIDAATGTLKPAWETGSAEDVQAAMTAFLGRYLPDLLSHAPYAPTQQAEFRAWSKQFAHWIFGTDHISVRYEVAYDGVDIRKLSPGTRGVVLLLLYLALDDSDDRPLIIDQPEENLDPKSVFDELVALFIAAKAKRQVIMVTHNANLVINTDADQIIVATAGPHPSGGLPPISYMAGGLESAVIRKAVCDILEGGEVAFRERARRLRVRLER